MHSHSKGLSISLVINSAEEYSLHNTYQYIFTVVSQPHCPDPFNIAVFKVLEK